MSNVHVRDWLKANTDNDFLLPEEVVTKTVDKYKEAYELLTGKPFPSDIYKLADSFLKQDDITLIERKDYIQHPKESGYRSLHLIVQVPIFLQDTKKLVYVEVQFRTIAMDFWASLEHKLRYKKDIPAETADAIAKQLQDCAEVVARTDKQMYDIRKQIEASGVKAGVE